MNIDINFGITEIHVLNININFGITEIQILNNITNKVKSTSKTHLLIIEINRNRFVLCFPE